MHLLDANYIIDMEANTFIIPFESYVFFSTVYPWEHPSRLPKQEIFFQILCFLLQCVYHLQLDVGCIIKVWNYGLHCSSTHAEYSLHVMGP
jgi:hypothetical protein